MARLKTAGLVKKKKGRIGSLPPLTFSPHQGRGLPRRHLRHRRRRQLKGRQVLAGDEAEGAGWHGRRRRRRLRGGGRVGRRRHFFCFRRAAAREGHERGRGVGGGTAGHVHVGRMSERHRAGVLTGGERGRGGTTKKWSESPVRTLAPLGTSTAPQSIFSPVPSRPVLPRRDGPRDPPDSLHTPLGTMSCAACGVTAVATFCFTEGLALCGPCDDR